MENNVSNNELLKEIERLQNLLAKHGICEDCGELYNHHGDEPFTSCGCKQSEWYELTPHMLQVQGLKTERDAFLAKVEVQNNVIKYAHNKLYILSHNRNDVSARCIVDADKAFKVVDDYLLANKTPQQCLRDVKAEAALAGAFKGIALSNSRMKFGTPIDFEGALECYRQRVLNGGDPDESVEDAASALHLSSTVRQGGAE